MRNNLGTIEKASEQDYLRMLYLQKVQSWPVKIDWVIAVTGKLEILKGSYKEIA